MDENSLEPRRATLKDVAAKAGVSVMSASYALRENEGERRVSAETRRRVLEVARQLDYRPDARARAFRTQRTNIVGFYTGFSWIDVRNPFFAEVIAGVQQGCEVFRKNLLLHSFSSTADSEEVYRELMDGRVDGLIVAIPLDDPLARRLSSNRLPVVAIADPVPGVPSVTVDDVTGGVAIANHLADLGHRRIVFASSPNLPTSAKRRQRGFVEHAIHRGMEVVIRPLGIEPDLSSFVCRAREASSAIVAWCDHDARRILNACKAAGIAVPQEMAIVGFDGCPTLFDDPHPLTTIRAPWARVALEAIKTLDCMQRKEAYDEETILPVQLVRGMTT